MNLDKIKINSNAPIEINLISAKINEAVEEYRNLQKVTKESTKYYMGYIHGLKTAIKIIEKSN